jgi:hypothetical protein
MDTAAMERMVCGDGVTGARSEEPVMDVLEGNGGDSPRSGVRLRRVGAAAAAGIGLTLGAAGIAAAASSPSPTPSAGTTAQPPSPGRPPGPPGGRMHRGGFGGGPGGPAAERGLGAPGAVRGEFVVPDGKGGWRTVQMQRGTVTAVSSTSLTVKSADGVSKTYVLTKDTLVDAARDGIATVAKGDTVGVLATVSGGTATATTVRDLTKIKATRDTYAPRRPPAPAPSGTPASPSTYDGGAGAVGA